MSEQVFNVTLQYPAPWGFRLAGGIDFNQPLSVSRITPGGKASIAHVLPSDVVLRIDGEDTTHMTHLDAQNKIKNCAGDLTLTLSRGEGKIWKPKVTPLSAAEAGHHNTPPYKVSLKADQQEDYDSIGSSHNVTAKPFPGTAKVVHLQYNSPVGIYSAQNIAETFKGQTEGLITGVVGGEEPAPIDTGTGSYQAVHGGAPARDYQGYHNPGSQSRSFKMVQDMADQDPGSYPGGGGGGSPAYGGGAPRTDSYYSSSVSPYAITTTDSRSVPSTVTDSPPADIVEDITTTPPSYGVDRNKQYSRSGQFGSGSPASPDSGVDRREQFDTSAMYTSGNPGAQSKSFKMLQQMLAEEGADVDGVDGAPVSAPTSASAGAPSGFRSVRAPTGGSGISNKPPVTTPICEGCDRGIVGPFVKIKGKSYHPECFVCTACHTNLKNQGYFDIGGKLYCEKDARSRVQPPEGAVDVGLSGRGGSSPGSHGAPSPGQYGGPASPPGRPTYQQPAYKPTSPPAGGQQYPERNIQSIRPAFKAPPLDPNEVIARALSQNPDATKDILGIKPIFTPVQKSKPPSLGSRSPLSSPTGSFDSGAGGVKVTFEPSERKTHSKQLSAPHQYAAAARGPLGAGGNKPLPPRPAGAPRQQIQRGAMKKTTVPPGTRTPMCDNCGETIRGPFVNAIGKNWHPEHFHCSHCNCSLMELGFVEEGGQLFCENDYAAYFASTCNKCQQPIVGDVLNALEKTWHPECFVCCQCQRPFSAIGAGSTFHVEDGKPYCTQDWNELFTTKCSGCQFPIEPGDKWVEALDTQWHTGCFTCTVCHKNLEGQSFYAKAGRPYCRAHASS
ncbi:PDZ and LIM domain protein 5-like isoform X3 [Ptychodera flava]|uniref:PDZ and LIM domain protein 5-like isoform X3 n=1 Tax=Ptychodera flava TaxID=63121 RepID=UPI00396A005B